MRQTQKYRKACERLTFPHQTQDALYAELNRLGWYWNSKSQEWERNETVADPPSRLIRLRVWAAREEVEQAAAVMIEAMQSHGLRLIEQSEPYPCRPPKQAESRIYLVFEDFLVGGDRHA